MKSFLLLTTAALAACSSATPQPDGARTTPAQAAPATQPAPYAQPSSPPPKQAATEAASAGSAGSELTLNDLNALTFACVKAGLNAAAREAAKQRALGSYQFSYFRLVSSSHHSTIEVHFKSNNYQDQDLKYCVDVYCQQGWDPQTANPTVKPIGKAARPARAGAAGAEQVELCSAHHAHARHRAKR